MKEKRIIGISPTEDGNRGFANLYESLFWGSWSPPPDGFPIILMGGWKDDVLCDSIHHIQRIVINYPPSLDVKRILLPSKFPFETTLPLELKGYIASNAKFQKYDSAHFTEGGMSEEARESWLKEWDIKYPKSKDEIMSMQWGVKKKRFERFDFIGAVWFADGRIFAANEKLIDKLVNLATIAAITSHEGGGPWKSLDEYSTREKEKENK